jgi:uncharacterized membrane protein YqgA involved in biofilm formation
VRWTIMNAAILVGSGIGLAVGSRMPERLQRMVTKRLGLSTPRGGVQTTLNVRKMAGRLSRS